VLLGVIEPVPVTPVIPSDHGLDCKKFKTAMHKNTHPRANKIIQNASPNPTPKGIKNDSDIPVVSAILLASAPPKLPPKINAVSQINGVAKAVTIQTALLPLLLEWQFVNDASRFLKMYLINKNIIRNPIKVPATIENVIFNMSIALVLKAERLSQRILPNMFCGYL
jgi:hypothetical protein